MDKYKSDLVKVAMDLHLEPVRVNYDESRMMIFREELERLISIQKMVYEEGDDAISTYVSN